MVQAYLTTMATGFDGKPETKMNFGFILLPLLLIDGIGGQKPNVPVITVTRSAEYCRHIRAIGIIRTSLFASRILVITNSLLVYDVPSGRLQPELASPMQHWLNLAGGGPMSLLQKFPRLVNHPRFEYMLKNGLIQRAVLLTDESRAKGQLYFAGNHGNATIVSVGIGYDLDTKEVITQIPHYMTSPIMVPLSQQSHNLKPALVEFADATGTLMIAASPDEPLRMLCYETQNLLQEKVFLAVNPRTECRDAVRYKQLQTGFVANHRVYLVGIDGVYHFNATILQLFNHTTTFHFVPMDQFIHCPIPKANSIPLLVISAISMLISFITFACCYYRYWQQKKYHERLLEYKNSMKQYQIAMKEYLLKKQSIEKMAKMTMAKQQPEAQPSAKIGGGFSTTTTSTGKIQSAVSLKPTPSKMNAGSKAAPRPSPSPKASNNSPAGSKRRAPSNVPPPPGSSPPPITKLSKVDNKKFYQS